MDRDLDQLFNTFLKNANLAEAKLSEMLSTISDGRVPTDDLLTELNTDLKKMEEMYTAIVGAAKSVLPPNLLPPEGSSVGDYSEAFQTHKQQESFDRIQLAKRTLERFIAVKSLVESYEKALEPYQADAKKLLDELHADVQGKPLDNIKGSLKGPELFLRALGTDSFDSEEGIELLEELSNHYPRRVQLGIQGHSYYLTDEAPVASTPQDAPAETPSAVKSATQEHIPAGFGTAPTPPVELPDQPQDDLCAESASPAECKVECIAPIKKVRTGAPSASSFSKEIKQLAILHGAVRTILPLLTNLGIMTAEQIHRAGVCMDCLEETETACQSTFAALDTLVSKGLLAAYRMPDDGQLVYCLTAYTSGCLQKGSISVMKDRMNNGFWRISLGQFSINGGNDMPLAEVKEKVAANEKLLLYLYGVKPFLTDAEYKKVKQSIVYQNGHCNVAVIQDGEPVLCVLYDGATTESGTFLALASDDLSSIPGGSRLFVFEDGKVSERFENRVLAPPAENLSADAPPSPDVAAEDVSRERQTLGETVAAEPVASPQAPRNAEGNAYLLSELSEAPGTPSDARFCELVTDILLGKTCRRYADHSNIVQAVLLAKAASELPNPRCQKLYQQLLLATNAPADSKDYSSESLASVFGDFHSAPEALVLSAYLFALLVPQVPWDYGLKSQAEVFLRSYEDYFPSLAAVKPLFAALQKLSDLIPIGFTEGILSKLGDESEREKYFCAMRSKASSFLNYSIPRTRMKALPPLYNKLFGRGSVLCECLGIVSEGKESECDYVTMVLDEYCDKQGGVRILNNDKVESFLDDLWLEVNGKNSSFELDFSARQQTLRNITSRLNLLLDWVNELEELHSGKYDIARLKKNRDELVELAGLSLQELKKKKFAYKPVLVYMLEYIRRYLLGSLRNDFFDELAYSGVITLDAEHMPLLDEDLNYVRYFEAWRRMLRHISSPITSYKQAQDEITRGGKDSILFDNLRQLEVIGELLGEEPETSPEQLQEAKKAAEGQTIRFMEKLELAFTYDRISETEKESLSEIERRFEKSFYERKDFGVWRQFLNALERNVDELTALRGQELSKRLNAKIAALAAEGKSSVLLGEAKRLLEDDSNFAVAEEYINRADSGSSDPSDDIQSILCGQNYFMDFIAEDCYTPLYNELFRLKDGNFRNNALNYLRRNYPADWTARLKDSSESLIKYWPTGRGAATESQIQSLLSGIGLNVKRVDRTPGKHEEAFRVTLIPDEKSRADYRHPISAFGTQAKSPMSVILLQGNVPAKQLVDTIAGMGLGGLVIVFLNYPVSLAVRRQIAEEFHKTSIQNPFILIDQVLFVHLALHQETERLPVMLQCTLPYTAYQPFVRDGGATADEMFCGRVKELASIKDKNGACVVYGGRQLGKTALLERAESLCHKPKEGMYAIYCNVIRCVTEEEIVAEVIACIREKENLEISNCHSLKELSKQFEAMFNSGKVSQVLLLLDETDNFLEHISGQNYAPLQPLIDLKRRTKNNFKFVLAGLHNVCRAKNATANNGVFGQLGTPLCIKPLSPTDALRLLSRPLQYLGFQIERYPHLETILTKTNYYPGILQFFGYMLVETLNSQYSKYYRAVDGNPPFTLQDDQLGAVINSADLNRSIKDKFRWSLELDQRYFMIARCIAVLYYMNSGSTNSWLGFTIDEIMEVASQYDILCLRSESPDDYRNLLDEMVDMGILSKPDPAQNKYRLRRSSFIDIIGPNFDLVDEDIMRNNGGV